MKRPFHAGARGRGPGRPGGGRSGRSGRPRSSSGSSLRHRSNTFGHRGWNGHPGGTANGLGSGVVVNAADIAAGETVGVNDIGAVAHQATGHDGFPRFISRSDAVTGRQRGHLEVRLGLDGRPRQFNLRYETPWLSEYLVANLLAQGATHAFGVPGESYLAVLDALRDSSITVTVCRHEGAAAMMAASSTRWSTSSAAHPNRDNRAAQSAEISLQLIPQTFSV